MKRPDKRSVRALTILSNNVHAEPRMCVSTSKISSGSSSSSFSLSAISDIRLSPGCDCDWWAKPESEVTSGSNHSDVKVSLIDSARLQNPFSAYRFS